MNVLLIGNGGREHALAWKIAQSPRLKKLLIAPGNAGTGIEGDNVALDVTDHAAVIGFSTKHNIDLVVVGPEAPLVAGLADDLRASGFLVFGPGKQAAQLEGSKAFTKAICDEMDIPTAGYGKFNALQPAFDYVRQKGVPIVIKADGLAAGKGVTVAMTLGEAEAALEDCFSGSFGAAGAEVVIEEFLEGEEVSVFAICDGQNFVTLASAQDHKRAFDGDKGPNTGGMGAYSPASVLGPDLLAEVENTIIAPTVRCLNDRGTPFNGVLYAGLMLTASGPKLIEYNARFGDPECQVLMMRLKSDLLDLLETAARGDVTGQQPVWDAATALTVVMAASGYPGSYAKGTVINVAGDLNSETVQVFHAGTANDQDRLLANGGRVLNVTALGDSISEAQSRAYAAIDAIDWPEGFCRRDIGWREINRTSRSV